METTIELISFERLLISSIYYFGSEAMQKAAECDLKPSDIPAGPARQLFEIALQMHEKQVLFNGAETFGEEAIVRHGIPPADFIRYTDAHAWDLVPSIDIPRICREIKRRSAQRTIANAAQSIGELLKNGDENGLRAAKATILDTDLTPRARATWKQTAKVEIERAHAIIAGAEDVDERSIPWPWEELNREFKPFRRRELAVLAGFTSCGKSSLCRQLCLWGAMHEMNTCLVSLEVPANDMFNLMASSVSGQQWSRLKNLHPNDQQAFLRGQEQVKAASVEVLDDTHSLDVILAWVRAQHQKRFLDIVAIDYLGLIEECEPARHESKPHAVGRVAGCFKRLAAELDCVVFLAVQTSRAHVNDNREPKLTDLKDSGDIEAHADRVLMLHRPAKNQITGERQTGHEDVKEMPRFYMELFQEKGRNVGTGSGRLYLRRELARFELIALNRRAQRPT